ncbi:Protein ripply2 [Merluccius polli]|uniref:Protein ripply2 n=1 Tax=Merluccius polli TaxID=89951 RepID=A0AA47NZP2_MERPO|nr:Protein ripply2 [Merluccius polli]
MDACTAQRGITSAFTAGTATDEHRGPIMWRPWDTPCVQNEPQKLHPKHGDLSDASFSKSRSMPITHPVKLYWPKSKCFDYLYQDAEMLLHNYPVQATICLYEEESSDEDSDDEDGDLDKDMN